uniref:RNA-dependent RNA polymerase n=1 Tax=Qualyub virus TaxID=1810949 RepID=UPI000F73517A|nr:Chain A, RNA-dependent RNA polymerase [Qualyub virus]6DX1_B Chain B, RNA-dependent RNA polymerase [Qualyub virus]6DX1_C Chain C, RNA-dependent RNA polymerase [Qualyub virus]
MANLKENIVWEHVFDNCSQANVVFSYREFFNKELTLPDGNCFFRAVSTFLYDTQNGWIEVKNMCREFAETNWDELPGVHQYFQDPEHYARESKREGYWGGSVEAEILSKLLKLTVIFWKCEDDVWVTQGIRWGDGNYLTAINLLHIQFDHFDFLVPINVTQEPPKSGSHHHHHH